MNVKFKLETSVLIDLHFILPCSSVTTWGNCHYLSLLFMSGTKLITMIDSDITCLFPAANKHQILEKQRRYKKKFLQYDCLSDICQMMSDFQVGFVRQMSDDVR